MRYFYDTEFIEDGRTIELVSIGIVAEDGREYYAVSTGFDGSRANNWVRNNVLNQLPNPSSGVWRSRDTIRDEVFDFLTSGAGKTELWAWVGAYDHVLLAQLWGDMTALPRELPRYTRELKQYWEMAGRPRLPEIPDGNHDALVDARHNLAKFRVCMQALPLGADNWVED
ncbi:polyadenylate-specific 3'-exoribonuclease AS [Corynebacterium gallinarum]|uniref:3'-5' exoribonuclease n=1 Tax=Corynebacterium gallinarum TaxID=2762214 RepID=A0A8I0HH81_9CORY|nr:polyadenylate-specific 3'-exoribonuclease AS [Corynebacterium gallinarum]MBD8028960.1 polyadenylate-specific 3'-exoribonuclease AS [Corynebacterium gallinarum]